MRHINDMLSTETLQDIFGGCYVMASRENKIVFLISVAKLRVLGTIFIHGCYLHSYVSNKCYNSKC